MKEWLKRGLLLSVTLRYAEQKTKTKKSSNSAKHRSNVERQLKRNSFTKKVNVPFPWQEPWAVFNIYPSSISRRSRLISHWTDRWAEIIHKRLNSDRWKQQMLMQRFFISIFIYFVLVWFLKRCVPWYCWYCRRCQCCVSFSILLIIRAALARADVRSCFLSNTLYTLGSAGMCGRRPLVACFILFTVKAVQARADGH